MIVAYTSLGPWRPDQRTGAAHSGANVWATNLGGDYDNDEDGTITVAGFRFSPFADRMIQLTWWEWLQSEAGYDYASVEVSADGGATWDAVYTASGDAALEWTERATVLGAGDLMPSLQVRFHFLSDESYVFPGWYVDDVALQTVECITPVGGLVIGNVRDDNTQAGLNGAAVATRMVTPPPRRAPMVLPVTASILSSRLLAPEFHRRSARLRTGDGDGDGCQWQHGAPGLRPESGKPAIAPTALNVALGMGQTVPCN